MLSEEFDKKIREAADHHHPTYDEKAWGQMEKLLDKHLPEEKDDRRRYFFFLLLFLLLGGGAWFFFGQGFGNRNKEQTTAVQTTSTINQQKPDGADQNSGHITNTTNTKPAEPNNEIPAAVQINDGTTLSPAKKEDVQVAGIPAVNVTDKTGSTVNKTAGKNFLPTRPVDHTTVPVKDDAKIAKADRPVTTSITPAAVEGAEPKNPADPATPVKDNNAKDPVPAANAEGTKHKDIAEKPQPVPAAKTDAKKADEKNITKKTKPVTPKKSAFFISVSAGPDISFTGNDKPGKMKLAAGAGIGYTFKEKFTLRTGFYSGRKIYTSSPGEYNPPDIFYTYYPNLQKVEADCKVYEIPLLLSYNFGQKGKHSWFASAGASTILMKRETYNYYYKYYPTGPTVQREYTSYNENKHFFSVATLSAGYQRTIGKNISLTAEPYFKLPLSGLGYGKVKLNSAGVLFSLSVKPFQKADKK